MRPDYLHRPAVISATLSIRPGPAAGNRRLVLFTILSGRRIATRLGGTDVTSRDGAHRRCGTGTDPEEPGRQDCDGMGRRIGVTTVPSTRLRNGLFHC